MLIRSTGVRRIDAIVEFEIRYNQTRWTEVWNAMAMTAVALLFLDEGTTFTLSRGYDFIGQYVTEKQAGIIGIIVGMARLFALWVNGSKKRSPMFRVIGSVGGALFWAALGYGFWSQPELPINTTSIMVPLALVFVCSEVHSSGRAARAAYIYWRFKEVRSPDVPFLV